LAIHRSPAPNSICLYLPCKLALQASHAKGESGKYLRKIHETICKEQQRVQHNGKKEFIEPNK
jgi:hypothetical protein